MGVCVCRVRRVRARPPRVLRVCATRGACGVLMVVVVVQARRCRCARKYACAICFVFSIVHKYRRACCRAARTRRRASMRAYTHRTRSTTSRRVCVCVCIRSVCVYGRLNVNARRRCAAAAAAARHAQRLRVTARRYKFRYMSHRGVALQIWPAPTNDLRGHTATEMVDFQRRRSFVVHAAAAAAAAATETV